MTAVAEGRTDSNMDSDAIWRALSNPTRRQLLDAMSRGPRTTGELAQQVPDLSRFAVMQHLGVLTDAGLVAARQRGRYRFNHLNPVPLRRWYERWVVPLADSAAAEMLALERTLAADKERGEDEMSVQAPIEDVVSPADGDQFRTVRIETELRFRATPERVWEAITERSLEWFPTTYGEERVNSIVLEPRVGGLHYEDWGEGRGHLYGQVTVYDPPFHLAVRGRLDAGTILDREYEISADGDFAVLKSSRVAVGPISEQQAAGIHKYGDIARFEEALRKVIEGA
jgi:DNA-binding transcriptional ArsR family regulator